MTMPRAGDVVGAKYRVLRLLGEGGMGAVLEVEHVVTGKRLAIKWLHADAATRAQGIERLLREARAAARIRHPNVVDIYDVEYEQEAMFLVMELLQGETLASLLERCQLPVASLLALLIPAMRGVAEAHRQGVVHRDVKPENIFLARELDSLAPVPKVLDFGIARFEDAGMVLTRSGYAMGTPLFMSLEQLRSERDVDARTDVYAFGVILYMAVTGRPPFPADNFADLVIRMTSTTPVPPHELAPGLPEPLSHAILDAIRVERAARTASLELLIGALTPFASELARVRLEPDLRASAHDASPDMTRTPQSGLTQRLSLATRAAARQGTPEPMASRAGTEPHGTRLPAHSEPLSRSDPARRLQILAASLASALLVVGAGLWLSAREQAPAVPPPLPPRPASTRAAAEDARVAQQPLSPPLQQQPARDAPDATAVLPDAGTGPATKPPAMAPGVSLASPRRDAGAKLSGRGRGGRAEHDAGRASAPLPAATPRLTMEDFRGTFGPDASRSSHATPSE